MSDDDEEWAIDRSPLNIEHTLNNGGCDSADEAPYGIEWDEPNFIFFNSICRILDPVLRSQIKGQHRDDEMRTACSGIDPEISADRSSIPTRETSSALSWRPIRPVFWQDTHPTPHGQYRGVSD